MIPRKGENRKALRGIIKDRAVELSSEPQLPDGTEVNVVLVPVEKSTRRKQGPIPGLGMHKGPRSKAAAIAKARKLRKQVMQRGRDR